MAKIVKELVRTIPVANTTTTAYTVPVGKYAVTKSVTITNRDAADLTFRLIVGGAYVAYDHVLKGKKTLIINDLDIPLLSEETIIVFSSTSSLVVKVSGFEGDYVASDYNYIKVNTTANSISAVLNVGHDVIIRSIIVCNWYSTLDGTIKISAPNTLMDTTLKPFDSLIIPKLQYFLQKDHSITYSSISGSPSPRLTLIMEKVVQ